MYEELVLTLNNFTPELLRGFFTEERRRSLWYLCESLCKYGERSW